jgi:hypothetical protein
VSPEREKSVSEKTENKRGRPSIFSEELAAQICDRIAGGESLRSICRSESMPVQTTVYRWLQNNEVFQQQYARARSLQAETYADEIADIADASCDRDSAAAARVRIDARKWFAEKVHPKKYGVRQTIEHAGELHVKRIVLEGAGVEAEAAVNAANEGAAAASEATKLGEIQ